MVYREDPFQRIVNVHWRSDAFALLAIQATGSGSIVPACDLFANGNRLGDFFGSINGSGVVTDNPYKVSSSSNNTASVTFTNMEEQFTDGWHPISVWIRELDETPPVAIPFSGGSWNGVGDPLSEWHEFSPPIGGTSLDDVFNAIWDARGRVTGPYRLGAVVGPFAFGGTSESWAVNAIAIVNLNTLRKSLKLASGADIEFTADTPHDWTAQAFTFKNDPSAFPLGPNNTSSLFHSANSVAHKEETSTVEVGTAEFDFIIHNDLTIE